jgi:hypothetical protein
MSTRNKKSKLTEAIEKGLENHSIREQASAPTLNTAGFEDPALGQDTEGKGTVLQTKEGPHDAAENQGTIQGYPSDAVAAVANVIAGKKAKKKEDSDEDEMKEETSIEEYLSSLFAENELSEDFKEKLTTIFSTALADRISHVQASLQETFNSNLNDQVANIAEDLSEKLDEFLSYVVEEWTKDNELAIERGIKADIAESFMNGLKDLFENHYIDMPDEKVQVMEELLDSKTDLEEQLNKQIETNIDLQKNMRQNAARNIFIESCTNLTDIEIEKYAQLAETIEFEDLDEYSRKLHIIKESFIGSPVDVSSIAEERVVSNQIQDLTETNHETIQEDPMISAYTKALSFQNRNRDK